MNPSMTCRQLIDFLGEWFGGGLPAVTREEFQRHLDLCPACVNYLRTYEQTVKLSKAACCGELESPPPVPQELVQAILAARAKGEGPGYSSNDSQSTPS